jgi:hypothetical protein
MILLIDNLAFLAFREYKLNYAYDVKARSMMLSITRSAFKRCENCEKREEVGKSIIYSMLFLLGCCCD